MKRTPGTIEQLFFAPKALHMAVRAGCFLLLGILLLWRPAYARPLFAALVALPAVLLGAAAILAVRRYPKYRLVGYFAVLAAVTGLGLLCFSGVSRLAVWGVALLALLGAAALLYDAFFAPGAHHDWQTRLIGAAGGLLAAAAGVLFFVRCRADFLQKSVLFGVFFISLAILTAAAIPWRGETGR